MLPCEMYRVGGLQGGSFLCQISTATPTAAPAGLSSEALKEFVAVRESANGVNNYMVWTPWGSSDKCFVFQEENYD